MTTYTFMSEMETEIRDYGPAIPRNIDGVFEGYGRK